MAPFLRLHPIPMLCLSVLCSALPLTAATAPQHDTHIAHLENVLGTNLELRIQSSSAELSAQIEKMALVEMDRLSEVVSTWSPASELRRAMAQAPATVAISPELTGFLALCEQWQAKTKLAFNPRVATALRLWEKAEKHDELPHATTLQALARTLQSPAWKLDTHKGTVSFQSDADLTFDAIAKGWIIDRVGAHIMTAHPKLTSLLINIGGDMRQWGTETRTVQIADPRDPAENATPMASARIAQQAIATSGGYHRGWTVGNVHYSHILDPQSGQPVSHITSASVIAPDAATADVLATVFSILPVEQSLAMAADMKGVQCLLSNRQGKTVRSAGWPDAPPLTHLLVDAAPKSVSTDGATAAAQEMQIDFELNNPGGRKYHRPYVAVWVEDADEFPLRTLVLWIQQGKDGLKYLRDLKRWYRMDKVRQTIDSENLVQTISSATRRPGQYNAVWDGKDNTGLPMKPGTYFLCIEAAREEGTYQLIRKEITWGGEPYIDLFDGNIEVSSAAVELRAKGATP